MRSLILFLCGLFGSFHLCAVERLATNHQWGRLFLSDAAVCRARATNYSVCACCQHPIDRACASFGQFASYEVGRHFRDLPAGFGATGSNFGSAANLHMPGHSTATRKGMRHGLSRYRSNALQHADDLPSLRQG